MSSPGLYLFQKKHLNLEYRDGIPGESKILDDDKMAEVLRRYNPLSFESLDLSSHPIKSIPQAVFSMNHLKSLRMGRTSISDEGIMSITPIIHRLERLHLNLAKISSVGICFLGKQLHLATSLQSLELSGNITIGDGTEAAKIFAEVLMVNSTLQTLVISNNSIGPEGIEALAQTLFHNTSLTSLCVGRNAIDSDNVRTFAKALLINSTLKDLGIKPKDEVEPFLNESEDTSLQNLAVALTINTTLTYLSIGTAKNREAESFLYQTLPLTSSLKYLTYRRIGAHQLDSNMEHDPVIGPILERNKENLARRTSSLFYLLLAHTGVLKEK